MDIIQIVNHYWLNTISRLALTQDDLPGGVPFMGVFVELFEGATLPSESDVTAKEASYAAMILSQKLLASLAAHRYAIANGGTTFNGIALQTDDTSRSDLMAAYIMATANPSYTIQWKTPAGFATLNAATILALGNAVAAFVQKCFSTEAALVANVAQYQTVTDIIAAFDNAMKG